MNNALLLSTVAGLIGVVMFITTFIGSGGEATSDKPKGWGYYLNRFGGLALALAMVTNIIGNNYLGRFIMLLIAKIVGSWAGIDVSASDFGF